MPELKHKFIKHCHSNALFQIFNSLYYCMICSAFIITNTNTHETEIKAIKPNNFNQNTEIVPCPLWSSEEKNEINSFINKKEYLKQRPSIIKFIKDIYSHFSLSIKTYFLSVAYLDRICTKIYSFNINYLLHACILCIILASKFNEKAEKALEVQTKLKANISKKYLDDEIYVLNLLNYNLNIHTSYDLLQDILNYGFIFEGENFDYRKVNSIYSIPVKTLYILSEINSYIDMSVKQSVLIVIGFARELFGLTPFNDNIKKIFSIKNEKFYNSGVKIIKKKIKIECNSKCNEVNTKKSTDEKKKNEGESYERICFNELKRINF